MSSGRRWHAPGLRGRVMLSFAIGASLVSILLAVSVFTISRSYMVAQREGSAERQTSIRAEYVRNVLDGTDLPPAAVVSDLELPAESAVLVRRESQWFASAVGLAAEPVLAKLGGADVALDDGTVRRHVSLFGEPYLAIGVPLNDDGDVLFELSPLSELESALRVLKLALVSCAVLTTLAGALLGLWASRRVLRPLHEVAGTAAQIAGGQLDTRLTETQDTDLTTIVQAFNAMVDSLQLRIDRERRFFGDVSHELRTPLMTLITSVSVLGRHEQDLPDRSRRALVLINAELEHLRRLLDHLLALARAEAGLHKDELEPLSLAELLEHTLAESKRSTDLLVVETDCVVEGRKLALERAFRNLMDNADKHGGGLVEITLREVGGMAMVVVDDAGPGVQVSERTRVFERFVTGNPSRKRTTGTGTGLGLALVAETVKAHDGRVRCVSRPGGGARFVVELPLPQAGPDPIEATPSNRRRDGVAPRWSSRLRT
ncbi:sensor histidine kinase [Rhodococcus spongiicola]|uniref:histidine kinase n=1 Tax=Rhodococcus spongiicola TaxID=2487352 RepID=A0A438AQX3_9NOCA|nr:HAMP domain-containing sensor histidine kinase [Rhodococcus spongiicola]RVW00954.1 sensor histidine kinase [Rhodococcus spongiicola]